MNWLTRRNTIYLLAASIAIFGFIVLLLLVNRQSTGLLTISAPSKTPDNASVEVRLEMEGDVDEAETQTLTLKAGESQQVEVPQATWRITGSTGPLKAIDIVQVGDKDITVTTPIAEQRALKQLASDVYGCPVVVGGIAHSFGCRSDGFITRHTPGQLGASVNVALFDEQYFGALQVVKNGLIGLRSISDEEQVIQYIDLATTSIQTVPLSAETTALFRREMPRIVTANQTGDSRFALLFDQANQAFLFQDITDTNPVRLDPLGKNVKLGSDHRFTMGSFSGERLVIYSGPVGENHEGEGTFGEQSDTNHADDEPSYVFEYGMDGKLQRTLDISSNTEIDAFYALTGDYYVADSPGGGLSFYYRENNTLRLIYDAANIGSWTVHDNKGYFLVEGVLYQLNPTTNGLFSLRSLYASSSIKASEVFSTSSGLVFTGVVGDMAGAPLAIYQVTDKLETTTQENPATTPEPPTTTTIEPALLGMEELEQRGLTSRQSQLLQAQLNTFVVSLNRPIDEITVNNVTKQAYNPSSREDKTTMYFSVALSDGGKYRAQLDQLGLRSIQLWLYDSENQQVFDSGVVTYAD